MARTQAASPRPEVKETIQQWQVLSGQDLSTNPNACDALEQLARHGCNSDTLILMLELLHIYHYPEPAIQAKSTLEDWRDDAHGVALALRRDAKRLNHLQLGYSAFRDLLTDMVIGADALEFIVKQVKFRLSKGIVVKKGRKTLLFLGLAAELIERKTKSKAHPHYTELLVLVDSTSPTGHAHEVSPEAFSRKIRRFRSEHSDYLAKEFGRQRLDPSVKLEPAIRTLIAEWKETESVLNREVQSARLKRVQKLRGKGLKFGVQVQGAPTEASSPEVKVQSPSPALKREAGR
jgi:hypothetical protein